MTVGPSSSVRQADVRKGKEELSKEKLTSSLPLQTPRAETMERITGLSHGGQEAGVLTPIIISHWLRIALGALTVWPFWVPL